MIVALLILGAVLLLTALGAPARRYWQRRKVWRLEMSAHYRETIVINAVRSGDSLPIVEVDVRRRSPEQFAEVVAEAVSEGETKIGILNGTQRDVDRTRP